MQRFKRQFQDPQVRGTQANIQRCIRLNDIEELGDGTHLISFDMMGLFSFRELTVKQSVDFWMEWLISIGLPPDTVTIHPDKLDEWSWMYKDHDVRVTTDPECIWSDGQQGGYCTEFYVQGVEIGNIVNTGGDCIDVGFGLDRILVLLGDSPLSVSEGLQRGIQDIIASGYTPSGKLQGHILKGLIRRLIKLGGSMDEPLFRAERHKLEKTQQRFERLWERHKDQPPEWWLDTHGVDRELWLTKAG